MTEVVHADIFFFITAVTVVVLGLCIAVALFYVVSILHDIRAIVAKVKKASEGIEQDFEDFRANVRNEGVRVRTIVELILAFITRKMPKSRGKKDTDALETE